VLLAGGVFVHVRIPPAFAGLGEIVSVLPVVLIAFWLKYKDFTGKFRPKRT
jgi:Cd2+-exporting ATPase